MKNKKVYPFERNNYFYGKLLTVRDFLDEQKYNNDKRRISNILLNGCGVVSGLSVLVIDEKTISVESGMAIDYQGREIVVEEGITKKLNVIEGFNELTDFENIYLCISYDEKREENVHAVTGGNTGESEFNRIKESYRLFLTNYTDENAVLSAENLLVKRTLLYNENGLRITQIMPMYVRCGETFELDIEIEKINLPRNIEIEYAVDLNGLRDERGEEILNVYFKDDDILPYKKIRIAYNLTAYDSYIGIGELKILKSSIAIGFQTYEIPYNDGTVTSVDIINNDVNSEVISRYLGMDFTDVIDKNLQNDIYLAKFRIIKNNEDFLIDECESLPFNQYIVSNNMLYALMHIKDYYKTKQDVVYLNQGENFERPAADNKDFSFNSGAEVIEVDLRSKNKVYFSNEISHGLGEGNVYICCAIEETEEESFYDVKKMYFGDMSIFKGSVFESEKAQIKTGIVSYTEKGTFRIGIKLLSDIGRTIVNVKWWAFRSDRVNKPDFYDADDVTVTISPDTVTVHKRESVKFNASVQGTYVKDCRWSVVENDGGKIDINGVYEAPNKEGVYEITAQSTAYPHKKATAFVVVKD